MLCSDTVPSRYAFTNPRLFKGEFEPRTVIAVDVAGLQLFGENNGVPQFARHVDLCIDHHAGNNGYADFTLLDAGAAAAQLAAAPAAALDVLGLLSQQPGTEETAAGAAVRAVLDANPALAPGYEAVRRAAGIELSAALARELETVQIPKFATDEYSCRRVPGVDSSEVR